MKEIIKIKNRDGENVVDARLLHKKLESKQEFAHWIKNRLVDFDDGYDYFSLDKVIKRETGATTRIDYLLTLDTAKHLCMMERNHIGKKFRQYFIESEKQLKITIAENKQLLEHIENKQLEITNDAIEKVKPFVRKEIEMGNDPYIKNNRTASQRNLLEQIWKEALCFGGHLGDGREEL